MTVARRTAAVLFVATACASAPEPAPLGATFDCGDLRFRVTFQNDSAILFVRDDTLRLPIAISASGARYSDGTHTYWEHQGRARLELPDTSYTDCRPIQPGSDADANRSTQPTTARATATVMEAPGGTPATTTMVGSP